jgi:signal transduction histidine kinase
MVGTAPLPDQVPEGMMARVNRFMLTITALCLTVVAEIGLLFFVGSTVGLGLVLVWVGIPVLLAATAALRWWANAHRVVAGRILGTPVVRPYRAFEGGGWFARLRWLLTDVATWRDMSWVLVQATAGITLTSLVVGLGAGTVFYLIYPFLVWVTPPGVFDQPFGFFTIVRPIEGLLMWPVALVAFLLWRAFAPPLMLAWATMTKSLLWPTSGAILKGRVEVLQASRADTVDTAAAEIRRIERDLHDGAQARLVAMGMSLGLADELIYSDPERARALLNEAREATSTVLSELRNLVRGIYPPVLADRGLVGAVRAIALDAPVPTSVATLGFGETEDQRLPAPVEACTYFVVSESLANIGKHARAERAYVRMALEDEILVVTVADDGVGGAEGADGSGLTGLARRLSAFDGTLTVSSPPGGPTLVTMEIPTCEPFLQKTTPFSVKV